MLKLIVDRETLLRRGSEQAVFARTVEIDIASLSTNSFWTERVLLFHAEKTQNQEIFKVRDYKRFPIMSRLDH